jgi:hypothetical protein
MAPALGESAGCEAPLQRTKYSNFYRQHDRSYQSMIPANRQEGEIPHETLRTFADIIGMYSKLVGHAAVGAAKYTRTMPVTDTAGRFCCRYLIAKNACPRWMQGRRASSQRASSTAIRNDGAPFATK